MHWAPCSVVVTTTITTTSWMASCCTAFVPTTTTQGRHEASPSLLLRAKQEATLGMGCFWAPSERLLERDGVMDTVVGYTGHPSYKGSSPPTYDTVCFGREWVEGVRVTYDDSIISYGELLEEFFQSQEPKLGSRQYASIIFPHSPEQEEVARQWISQDKVRDDGVTTQTTSIEPLSTFYQAEGYHQRYWQKMRPRFAAAVALLSVASGAIDAIVPADFQSTLHSTANGAVLLGCAFVLLEQKLDATVVKLES